MYERSSTTEREFGKLLALMANMLDEQAKVPADSSPPWLLSFHTLSIKLWKHLCSARGLLEPSQIAIEGFPVGGFIDHSSIAVIARSSIETYLVMNWLNAAGDDSLRGFRYTVWHYCGMKKRSKICATTEDGEQKRHDAEVRAGLLLQEIEASPHFARYTGDQRKKLRKGNWDVDWRDLAAEVGLHNNYFASVYPYLSGYVHSDFISSLQIDQARLIKDQYKLGISSIQIFCMLLGHLSSLYASLFPAAQEVLYAAGEAKLLAEKWFIKAEDMDHLYRRDLGLAAERTPVSE